MGFHLVESVYKNVVGTSSTAQAVLAYLAFVADDKGNRKCYPSIGAIESATHFKHTGICNALNELREAQLLKWTSGGRQKGNGGRSLANEYSFNLPPKPPFDGRGAASAKRTLQSPRGGNCICRDANTASAATRQPSSTDHNTSHPSVNADTEAATDDLRFKFSRLAASWRSDHPSADADAVERREMSERTLRAVVNEAMLACGDRLDNLESRKCFYSTLFRRDLDQALDVIHRFSSEMRAGEHQKLNNPAGCLNHLLAKLPLIR